MEKRTLGQGDVEVVLTNDKGEARTFVLKPSLHAMRTLSRKYGGLEPLIKKIGLLDFDTIVDVMMAGMQITPDPKRHRELEELVFSSGLSDQSGALPSLCVRYVIILMHGGKPPAEEPKGDVDTSANPPNAS